MFGRRDVFEDTIKIVSQCKTVVIYGAGLYGQLFLKYLYFCGIYKKVFFAETEPEERKEILGCDLCDISQFVEWDDETIVVVAAGTKYVQEMVVNLEQLGISKYVVLTDEMRQILREFKSFFSKDYFNENLLQQKGKEHNPLVSVLVPVYNTQSYLRECLDSLCIQTFTDFEVICIDDGSTDESLNIIREYMERDQRFRVITKKNTGYGDSMNQGLQVARGKYITILESDDFAEFYMLHRLYSTVAAYEADIVVGNYYVYHNEDNHVEFVELLKKISNAYGRVLTKEEQGMLVCTNASIWKGIYKKSFLESQKIDFLPTKGASYQDTSFAFKAYMSANKIVAIKEPVLYYRRDHGTASVQDVSKIFCICEEFMEIKRYIGIHNRPEWYSLYAQSLLDRYFWNYNRLVGKSKDDFLERYVEDVKECLLNGWTTKERLLIRSNKLFNDIV